MKAILINDTSSNDHVGCNLVIKNTLRICNDIGIDIVQRIENNIASPLKMLKKSRDFDCLLINGEGTMHHDRAMAVDLCECAKWCKANNKKVVLYNSVWEANKLLNNYLTYFDKIYCRESLSAALIKKEGVVVTVVPDMIFSSICLPAANDNKGKKVIVIDAVRKSLTRKLGWFSVFENYNFLVMSGNNAKYIRKSLLLSMLLRLRNGYKGKLSDGEFFAQLFQVDNVISARFHGTCLALMLGKNTASISSNTHKIEGLYQDIGLGSDIVMSNSTINKKSIKLQWDECHKKADFIKAYIDGAPKRIKTMFEEIRGLQSG